MTKEKTGLASIDQPWLQQYDLNKEFEYKIDVEGKTVWEVVEEKLSEYSDVPLIEYFNNKNVSRENFYDYVIMWAKTFKALNVNEGDFIPLYMPATPESYAMFLAANAIGAIPYYQKLDISSKALEEETKEAKIAVVFDMMWNNVKDVFEQNKFKNVIVATAADSMLFPLKQMTKFKSYLDAKKNNIELLNNKKYIWVDKARDISKYYTGDYKASYKPNSIAAITTSSGTTSHMVKGIMDTNEGILSAINCALNSESGFEKGRRMFTVFPLTASTSLNCEHLLPTFSGGTIVMDPRCDISLWYNQLMKYKPDMAVTTGSVWERFARDLIEKEKSGKKQDLSWADYFLMGGSGTTPEILEWINSVILEHGAKREIKSGYGLSEVFGVLSVDKYLNPKKSSIKNDQVISVGVPVRGFVVGIFDENGKELPYGTGARGELWVKSPSNMHGYYNKPDITSDTIIDGWIHTGDLCEIDEVGNIYVYGRLKNTIVVDNQKLYLFDIANDLRLKFKLHEVIVERKKLVNGKEAINVYYAQNEEFILDSEDLINQMDEYLYKYNITVNGYKEHAGSLPIDPTTIKPRTKDVDGFVKYINGEKYDVSYNEVELDVYEEKFEKVMVRERKKGF